ncbi:MAG: damage-inducible protein CinA [Cellvibrionales bacterium TMED122]|nr:damage-inducible protein CinA [Halieaceae bacterium]OUV66446.1 MAG: damage-inducible protein CinA [Cellvibrionales bacterium TMED122]
MTHTDIHLLLTGDELMSGDTVDSNSSMIAQSLSAYGHSVEEKVTLGDDRTRLIRALERATGAARILIMNGGLGPTQDDLTAELVAAAAGTELVLHPEADRHVREWCAARSIEPNEANLKQAWLPAGASIIANPRGSAAGFAIEVGGTLILTTPGVPGELRAMLPEVCERIVAAIGGGQSHRVRLQTFGIGESTAQARLDEDTEPWPESVTLGFRASMPQLEIKLSADSASVEVDQCRQSLERLIGDHIIGEDDMTLAGALQQVLCEQGKKMVTAESCTGGLIAAMMTAEPGSSAVFEAGFVTYANSIKHSVLGVDEQTLESQGAVSEPVVLQMLSGALERSGADIGVAVSGIAGPDGGTDDKPVGTVWLAWGTADNMHTLQTMLHTDRAMFQKLVAAAGLDLIRRQLLGLPKLPHYFSRRAI